MKKLNFHVVSGAKGFTIIKGAVSVQIAWGNREEGYRLINAFARRCLMSGLGIQLIMQLERTYREH